MKKADLLNLEKGTKIQHKRNNSILTVVAVQEDKIVCEEKTISISNCTRWFDVVEIPEVVEPDNTILDDIEQADELTSEQDTTANTEQQEDTDTTAKKDVVEPTIQQSNLIQSLNNLIDLHNVRLEPKREYIKVTMEGKRGALCMIRNSRYGSLHIDMKSKVFAGLTEEYRDLLIEQYGCRVYDKSRGYYRVFNCNDIEVLQTIILTAKSIA